MIETLKYSTISRIYVKDLFFFESTPEKDLIRDCKNWGISYVPSTNRKEVYKFQNGSFKKHPLTDDLVCNPYDLLFSDHTLDKFESGNHDEVLFVIEEGLIKGVVHIIDYNTEFIYLETFKLLHHFEKNLRAYLTSKGETNDSFLDWLRLESSSNNYLKSLYGRYCPKDQIKLAECTKRRRESKPFQTFYLSQILDFACSMGHFNFQYEGVGSRINDIRNWVAHSKDITTNNLIDNREKDGVLYSMDDLKEFSGSMNVFFDAFEELEHYIFQKL